MDPAVIGALSAVLGSVVGGSTSITTAWFTQSTQGRRESVRAEIQKRQTLYADFIAECSRLAIDALSHRQCHVFAIVIRAQRFWLLAGVTVLSGCASAPSISILGAFFPSWMLCIIAGIVLTLVLRVLLKAVGLDEHVGPRGVIYPAAVVLLTLVTWMAFFAN